MLFFERFFQFFAVLQEANIRPGFVRRLPDPAQRRQHLGIDLAGIGLSGDDVAVGEPHLLGDQPVEPVHFVVVAAEQRQETRLRAGGSLHAAESQRLPAVFEFFQIQHEIVTPHRGPFADGRRLGGLQVGETETCLVAVLLCELRQFVDDSHQTRDDDPQAVPDLQQFGVVGDETARRPEMDDSACRGTAVAERVVVGHHIVTEFALVFRGPIEIDVIHRGSHFGDLFGGNLQPEFPFGFRQRHPQPPPGGMLRLRRPDAAHLRRRVPRNQRVFVELVW